MPAPLTDADLEAYSAGTRPSYEAARCCKYQLAALAYVSGMATREIEDKLSVPAGRLRAIGTSCSWLAETAAKIARMTGQDAAANTYETMAARFQHGCTEKALLVAQVPYRMHRHEREAIVGAGYDTLQRIVEARPVDVAKTARVSVARVEGLQKAIVDLLGDALDLERQQVTRLATCGVDTALIEELYAAKGTQLEQAVEAVLRPPFCRLTVSRIARQSEGEADLRIILSDGKNGIASVTAKDRPTDKVSLTKAGSVLQQSPELSPQVFICFGRPDFDPAASKKATAHAAGGRNYKLIRICTLAEMFVRFHEKRLTSDRVREILEVETGDITMDRL